MSLAALRRLSVYPAAFSLALAVAVVVDSMTLAGPRGADYWVFTLGLALPMGALTGGLLAGALWLLGRLPGWPRALVVAAACLGTASLIARSVSAFAHLGGRYHWLAVGTLASCGSGALAAAALIVASVPGPGAPLGWLLGRPARWRWALAALLGVAAWGLAVADRKFYVGLYPQVHLVEQLGSVALLALAIALAATGRAQLKLTAAHGLGLLAWLGLTLLMFDSSRSRALSGVVVRPWPALVLRAARWLTDLDRDGYPSLLAGGDCNDLNSNVHPAAREIPGNGIDDNCVLGDAAVKTPIPVASTRPVGPVTRDVVLITVDTLRPDHMGIYNLAYASGGRNTTPSVDSWAARATVFRNAFTSGGWTAIALSSLMRGLYPRRLAWKPCYETTFFRLLEAKDFRKLMPNEKVMHYFPVPADDPHPTLAELLVKRGVATLAVVDDGQSSMLERQVGLGRGFQRYRLLPTASTFGNDQLVTRTALAELQRIPQNQRFLLWVHYFGPHSPSVRYHDVPTYGPSIADGYDHEILHWDLHVGRLLRALEKRSPPPSVILVADHGETLTPTNRFHGFIADEATMRIPFLVRAPDLPVGMFDSAVSLVDVLPTVLGFTNTPLPQPLDGQDLRQVLYRAPGQPPRVVLFDIWRHLTRDKVLDVTAAADGQRIVTHNRQTHSLHQLDSATGLLRRLPMRAEDPLSSHLLGYAEESAVAGLDP